MEASGGAQIKEVAMAATARTRAVTARRRPLLLAALIAAACIAYGSQAGADPAQASHHTYCGVLINSGTWCGNDRANFTWNEATYSGGGSVWVCQRLVSVAS